MTVDLLHGYVPQIGKTFDIMNFASASGTFSSVVGLPINGQEHFVLQYNPTNTTLDVESGQILGPTVTGHGAFSANDRFISSGEQAGDGDYLTASDNDGPVGSTPEPGGILRSGPAWRDSRKCCAEEGDQIGLSASAPALTRPIAPQPWGLILASLCMI